MKNKSIWNDVEIEKFNNSFSGVLKTDVLIVGAGITGLTTAYFLKDVDEKIVVVDKGKICEGITNKTTGKVNYLQGAVHQKIERYHGFDKAKLYYESSKEAINIIKNIIKLNNIDCDLVKEPSCTFTLEECNIKKITREEELLRVFGENVKFINDKRILKGIEVLNGYSFHPIKYLKGMVNSIKDKVEIYEDTLVTSYERENNRYVVQTNKGKIITKKLVIACHYLFFIIPLLTPLKTHLKREYVNVGKVNVNKKYNAINIDKNLHSIRFHEDYLIYTSNEHKLTSKFNYKKNRKKSIKEFKKYFGNSPEYSWINQDIVSNDYLPFIGKVKNNLYVATAFNGWGMTNGTIAGKLIADLILKKENKYETLFNPRRMSMTLIINSIVESSSYLKAYLYSYIKPNPVFIKKGGMTYGIYKDDKGIKHSIKLICPHMKCKLIFNYEDETWDCPCHGSRFDLDGNIIEGPSVHHIKEE